MGRGNGPAATQVHCTTPGARAAAGGALVGSAAGSFPPGAGRVAAPTSERADGCVPGRSDAQHSQRSLEADAAHQHAPAVTAGTAGRARIAVGAFGGAHRTRT